MKNPDYMDEDGFWYVCKIQKEYTNLPCNIYVDDFGCENKQREINVPKIYFQDNNNDKFDVDYLVSISISNEPKILDNIKINLSEKEINEIKKFIINNENILLKQWYQEVDELDLFKKIIVNNIDNQT